MQDQVVLVDQPEIQETQAYMVMEMLEEIQVEVWVVLMVTQAITVFIGLMVHQTVELSFLVEIMVTQVHLLVGTTEMYQVVEPVAVIPVM